MNKLIIPAAAVLLAVGLGGGAYIYTHRGTPLQNARALLAKGDVRGAQIELRNAVKAEPGNAEAHAALAELQLQSGDPIAAEREVRAARDLGYSEEVTTPVLAQALLAQQRFDDVLAQVPPTAAKPEAAAHNLVFRSLAQISLKNLPAAEASLAEAQRLSPGNADALDTSARLAVVQNNLPEAEARVDRALAINAKRPDSLLLKSQILAAKGDRPGAIDALDKAVTQAPDRLPLRLERASQLLQGNQDAKARADVDAVLAKEPKNALASYLDLVLLVRASKFAEADVVATRMDQVLPRFPRGLFFLAVVKGSLNQVESAADAARRYVARAPNDPEGVRLLAQTEIAAKRPEQAVAALEEGMRAGVNDAATLDLLGRAYALSGKVPLAAQSFQKASDLAPQNPDILTRLASTKMQMGDTGGATTALERSLDLAPKQANAGEALVAAELATGDLDKAQAALDRMRQQIGDTEPVGVMDAMIKLSRRDIEGARVRLAETAQRFPDSVVARVNLAKVLLLQGKAAEAEEMFRGLLAKSPASPDALNPFVGEMLRQNRVPDAIAAVKAARAATPGNVALTAALADLQVRGKDERGALATLNEAQAAANGNLPTQLLPALARAQAASADVDGAKATLRRYVEANPRDLDTLRAYIELLINSNDVPGAKQVLQEALQNNPGNLGMMQAAVLIEARYSGLPAALAKAEELRRNPANMPAAGVLKGDVLVGAKRYAEAAAAFADEAKAAPSTGLAVRQATALIAGGNQDQATALMRAWLTQHPDDAEAAQVLASLDITAKRLPDAETHLKTVLAKRPNDPAALNNLAWVYQQRNNPQALALAQRAYTLSPTAESADTLGWLLASTGDAKGAVPLLQQASAARPTDPSLRYHLAVALNGAGQKDEAVKLLETLAAEPATFEDKAAARKLLDGLKAQR